MNNTCQTCRFFFQFHGQRDGHCYLNPPVVCSGGQQYRPKVKVNDEACSHWQQAEARNVKEKRQPPTHGDVVRDAQQANGLAAPTPAPAAPVSSPRGGSSRRR